MAAEAEVDKEVETEVRVAAMGEETEVATTDPMEAVLSNYSVEGC